MTEADQIAAFLARKGATVCAPGLAYGVDAEADRAKRAEARHRKAYRPETECEHDARMERAHEAFFTGDREAGYAELAGYRRTSAGHYSRVRLDRF